MPKIFHVVISCINYFLCIYNLCYCKFLSVQSYFSIELVGCVTTLTGDEVKLTMATYGKVKAFNPKADDWEVYEEQLRFFMVANNITDAAKKRSILLTVCGDHTFKLLRSLVPDGKLDADDITYDSLVGLLKSHYKKKQSVVVHRFNFNTRARKPSESIADYIAALRELAMNCNFGSKERLEEMLRDRLVCGVNHQGIQRKLLSEGDISYTDALALAQSIESAEDDAKKSGGHALVQPVQYTQKGVKPASSLTSQHVTVVAVLTWLLPVHTKRRCAGTAKRKATWTGCAVLRLVLLQRAILQPLVPHQTRSLQRGHTMSKNSQNKRTILVGTNTALMPFTMNILLHLPSPSTSTTLQSRWKSTRERQFPSSMKPPSTVYSSPRVPHVPWNQSVAS